VTGVQTCALPILISQEITNSNYSKMIDEIDIGEDVETNNIGKLSYYKELHLDILNKIKNSYMELYLTRNFIGDKDITNPSVNPSEIPRYWMPKSSNIINPTTDKLKKYFKIKAEILDILDRNDIIVRYFMFDPSVTRSGIQYNRALYDIQYYKPQELIIKELNSFIFPEYRYVHETSIGTLNILYEPQNINNLQRIISEYYPQLKETITYLFVPREDADYTDLIQNIIIDGEWIPINRIDEDNFAINILHSSQFEYESENIILESLGFHANPMTRMEVPEKVLKLRSCKEVKE